jgi:dipeptidyl aminopeptidase/acylaminoacyl peptidase
MAAFNTYSLRKPTINMKQFLLVLAMFLFFSSAFPQSIGDYLSVPFPSDLQASASGQKIAWVFNDRGMRNIFLAEAPAYGAKAITRFSSDDGIDINSLQFSPDGTRLAFVKGNAPNSRGEAANPAQLQVSTGRTIWIAALGRDSLRKIGNGYYPRFSPDGKTLAYLNAGEIWTVETDSAKAGEKLFSIRGGQHSIRWSPDSKKIAFVSSRGDHSFIGLYDRAKKTVEFIETTVDNDVQPAFSPDGSQLAWIRVPNQKDVFPFMPEREGLPFSIHIKDLSTGSVRQIWKADPGQGSQLFDGLPVTDNLLIWTYHNQLIFPWEKDGWVHLYQLDPANGKSLLLTPGEGEVENVMISKDHQTLYYACNIGDIDRRHIWKRDLKNNLTTQITKGESIEWSPVLTEKGLAFLHASAVRPAWPALLNSDGKKSDLAPEKFPSAFPAPAMVKPQAVFFKAKDGMQIPAQLFYPKNHKPGEKHPALIFFHGGSRRQMLLGFNYGYYYSNAYALNQYFASKGYIVLSVNYRSGIGYGLQFREALHYGAQGASEVNDVLGAGLYLKQREDVDSGRIALWGGSYGGYLTAMGLAKESDLFACGVDIHGVHDWNEVIKNFVPTYNAEKLAAFAKKAYESSPMYFMDGWKSPVLLIHGDDDRNVPFGETVSIAEQLRKRNIYFEQLIFPDEVHSFLLHKNWVQAYEASYRFISKYFKQ